MKRTTLCLLLLVMVAGCDGHTSLNGEIVGPNDKPIAGVKVRLSEQDDLTHGWDSTTDEAGLFSAGLIHAPSDITLVVTATKDGYKPYRHEFKASHRRDFPKKITLEPDPQALGAAKD